jgi:hypothetical protein
MAFREWSAGDFGGPAEGTSPWGSPSPGPGRYAAADKDWFSESLATSSAKVVSSVADKIVDHDGMMLDEFNNVVSDLGDEMRAEMKELRAELRALVVAKVSAQEKEIRELRDFGHLPCQEGRRRAYYPSSTLINRSEREDGEQRTTGAIVRPSRGCQNVDRPSRTPLGPECISAEA